MAIVERWTGADAKALRQALRLSVRAFAEYLGVSPRTVTSWESRGADITPIAEMQRALDTALARADDDVKARFSQILGGDSEPQRAGAPATQWADGDVLLPVVVNGSPVLVPLDASSLGWFTARSGVLATSPGNTEVTVAEWEAMSPLNRRLLLKHGLGLAALPLLGQHDAAPQTSSRIPPGVSREMSSFMPGAPPAASWASPIYHAVLNPTEAIRRATSNPHAGLPTRLDDFAVLRQLAGEALTAHLSSDYTKLSATLPRLIGYVESASLQGDVAAASVQALLSDVYAVAAWSLIKADSSVAAWIAAQRAIQVAEQADDVLRVAAATRCLSEVHMRAKNFEEATRTAFLATVRLDTAQSADRKTAVCLRGAALLSAAAAAARRGDSREAYAALKAAAVCAAELGEDRSDLGTVFGPTNVAIHQVAVAVELGDTKTALRHVPTVKLAHMPAVLTERRARFLIDVARTHTGQHDDGAALGALLQAECIAPHELREHRLTHELLRDLLSRERRSSGVHALAARCKQLN